MMDQMKNKQEGILTPELLRERARQYARQDEKIEILGTLKQFFCFRLGQEWYVIEMGFLQETIPSVRISRLPRSKEFLLGMMNVRGNLVLMVDLARLLHVGATQVDERSKVVLLKTGEDITGFPVDEIQEVIELDTGRAQDSIATIKGIEAEFIKGLFRHKDKYLVWIDIERVLFELESR